mmetsp:Transcript_15722/g.27930  ORF Transcript_15722/g.27930 Transcript_15722/m.27930 type:complete len:363 (-) Transcript_15722:1332-2420(-)
MPRHPAGCGVPARAVVSRNEVCRGLEERASDLRSQLGKAVDVLRPLQGVGGHVVGQTQPEDGRGVEAADEARLVLRAADLVAHAARALGPDLRVLPGEVADGAALGVVALLRGVPGRDRHPAAALFPQLLAKLLDVILVGGLPASELREGSGLGHLLRQGEAQVLHCLGNTARGPAIGVDALPWPIALDDDGGHLIPEDAEHSPIRVFRDLDVSESLVGRSLAGPELWAGEEVVHGLRVGRHGAHDHRLPELEVHRGIIAHLLPGTCNDHGLAQLRVRGEGDLPRREELGLDEVQPGPAHAQDVAWLVGDLALAVGVPVQPARVQHHRGVGGRLELRGWVALGAHHELGKGVAPVALGVHLQ